MTQTGVGKFKDSDGNRVNVGNFDSDGFNVNNYWNDNRNDNLGLASSVPPRNFLIDSPLKRRVFLFLR